jgi:hypothetical protein
MASSVVNTSSFSLKYIELPPFFGFILFKARYMPRKSIEDFPPITV